MQRREPKVVETLTGPLRYVRARRYFAKYALVAGEWQEVPTVRHSTEYRRMMRGSPPVVSVSTVHYRTDSGRTVAIHTVTGEYDPSIDAEAYAATIPCRDAVKIDTSAVRVQVSF